MSTFPGTNNPIVYAQFRVRGGVRSMLIAAGGALACGVLIVALNVAGNYRHQADYGGAAKVLLGISGAVLLLYGSSLVNRAIRTDITSHMIESHRLMMLSPTGAVLGYWLGAPLISLVMAATLWAVGGVCFMAAGLDMQTWVVSIVMLLAFALMVWALVAMMAFTSRGAIWLTVIVIFFAFASNVDTVLLPPVAVLGYGTIVRPVFATWPQGDVIPWLMLTLVAEGVLAGLALLTATGRYGRFGRPGTSVALPLLMMLGWAAISMVGLRNIEVYEWRNPHYDEDGSQRTAIILTTLLIGMLPLLTAARAQAEAIRRRAAGLARERRIVLPVVMLICGVILLPLAVTQTEARFMPAVVIATLLALGEVTLICILGSRFRRAWIPVLLFSLLSFLGPLIAGAIISSNEAYNAGSPIGVLSASPIGAIYYACTQSIDEIVPGLIFQMFELGLLALLAVLICRRFAQAAMKPMPVEPEPSSNGAPGLPAAGAEAMAG